MVSTVPKSTSLGEGTVVTIVVSGEIIHPITDDLKLQRKYVDAAGQPKRAHVSLLPTDEVKVVQFELYREYHRCDLCGSDSKSPRVLLLENTRTGTRFYAAGDCLVYHFDRNIEDFFRAFQQYRTVLESASEVLGIREEAGATTQEIIGLVIERFEDLESYACKGSDELRALLSSIERDPSRAASGRVDMELKAADAYITVHADYAQNPELHMDRWRALLGHPVSGDLSEEDRAVLTSAADNPASLRLEDYPLLLGALAEARDFKVPLRNPDVPPWEFADRTAYHEKLNLHYQFLPYNSPRLSSFHVANRDDQQKLGSRLSDEVRADRRRAVTFWQIAVAPSQLEKLGALPDEDTLVGHGAQICRTEVEPYFEKPNDPTTRMYRRGVSVYYIDRWYEAYAYWFSYRELGGRSALEVLERPGRSNTEPEADSPLPEVASPPDDSLGEPTSSVDSEAREALDTFARNLAGMLQRAPTPAELEALRKSVIGVYYAQESGDDSEVAGAQRRLEQVLAELGMFPMREA